MSTAYGTAYKVVDGTVSGGSANRIAYWTGPSSLSYDSGLQYTGSQLSCTDDACFGSTTKQNTNTGFSCLYTLIDGDEAEDNFGMTVRVYHNNNTASSGGSVENFAIWADYRRTVTANTTDTNNMVGSFYGASRLTATGFTLTNSSSGGFANFFAEGVVLVGGTMAYTHWAGFYTPANTTNTGTNKYGVRIGDLSGATNNYSVYTGSAPNSFGGYVELRGNHDPGAPTDAVRISGKVSTDTGTPNTLHLRTEQDVEAIGSFTASHKLRVWINNVEYHIQLDAV